MNSYILYLANEAVNWENATPVGCGTLGAMLWGGADNECLQLNEEKLWAGGPIELHAEGFAEKLEQVRALLREGKNADTLATESLDPYFFRIKSYESAGNLRLAMQADGDASDYRRELDLVNGIASVTYKRGGIGYGQFKKDLFEAYWEYFRAAREKREWIMANPGYVDEVLADGAAKAREAAAKVLSRVRKAVGLI